MFEPFTRNTFSRIARPVYTKSIHASKICTAVITKGKIEICARASPAPCSARPSHIVATCTGDKDVKIFDHDVKMVGLEGFEGFKVEVEAE